MRFGFVNSNTAEFMAPRWTISSAGMCLFAAFAILLCVVCLPFDLSVSQFMLTRPCHGFLSELVENTEPFGHAVGVIVILAVMAAARPRLQKRFLWIGCVSLGAGLLTDLVKFSIGRIRPRDLDWEQVAEVTQTFIGWFPLVFQNSSHTSFPSGHTTVAFAFAVCLACYYPAGRWAFGGLAVCVGLGRVYTLAHYPSDVCLGAAIGWTTAWLSIHFMQKKTDSCLMSDRSTNCFLQSTQVDSSLQETTFVPSESREQRVA